MHATRLLPAVALLLFLPARADDGPAAKAPAQADATKNQEQMSCCAGEEKAKCPRAKAAASSKKTAPAAAARTAVPGAAGTANMVVTRDPETGKLRNATAAERETLHGRRPLATAEHKVVTLPDGSVMVELGEADMSYAVATRSPDGMIAKTCVHGAAAAAKAVASPAPVLAAPATPADR